MERHDEQATVRRRHDRPWQAVLRSAPAIAPVLRCPGCLVAYDRHQDHGRCPECGQCWTPGPMPTPHLHIA